MTMNEIKVRAFGYLISVLVVTFATTCAQAQSDGGRPGATTKSKRIGSAPVSQPAPNAAPTPATMITSAFTTRGVRKCTERIGQFSKFLTDGAQIGGQVFVAPEDADARIASASLEIEAGPAIAYAGLTFAPDASTNRCGGVYELVTYWPNNCEDVASKAFSTLKRSSPLRQAILALDGGPTLRIFLMPAGTGCISIKKESTY